MNDNKVRSGYFSRFSAFVIDLFVVLGVSALLVVLIAFIPKNVISDDLGGIIILVMPVLLFLAYRRGKTIGKKLLKINLEGETLTKSSVTQFIPTPIKKITSITVVCVLMFIFTYIFIAQPHKLLGSSMEPNYKNGSYYITEKLSYKLREPDRGEVVTFRAPLDESQDFISRVVAVPGDKIIIKDGAVYLNNSLLNEKYLQNNIESSPSSFLKNNEEYTVLEDEYIVLSDNRKNSSDSRDWGPVPKSNIIGRLWFVYYSDKQ